MLTEADRRHTHGRSDLYVDLCGKEFADGKSRSGARWRRKTGCSRRRLMRQ
jgi:hypothetical protein